MMTCDMTVEPSSLVNTHRKAADGSKPWLPSEMATKCRVQWAATLPLIARSAPPEARVVDGVTDDQEGSISSGKPGDKSRDESETTTVAAPPGPVQVAQLIQREKKEKRRRLPRKLTSTPSWSKIAESFSGTPPTQRPVQRWRKHTRGLR